MKCKCGKEIPEARLLILPETKVCVDCSSVKPYRGFISGTAKHKGNELIIVDGDDPGIDYMEEYSNGIESARRLP